MVYEKAAARMRRRAIAWSAALLALTAAVGGGYMLLQVSLASSCRAQLQSDVDRTAVLAARTLARQGQHATSNFSDEISTVTLGQWDAIRRRFDSRATGVNAAEVIAKAAFQRDSNDRLSNLLGRGELWAKTRAVAAVERRDIVFVVELSGGMTDRTFRSLEPILQVGAFDPACGAEEELQQVYADLGFTSYPGQSEPFGLPWNVGEGRVAYEALIHSDGPLCDTATNKRYRIDLRDSIALRHRKAYQAVIDRQVIRLMPEAKPRPDLPENFEYWAAYLDDVLGSEHGARIGYASYLQFMLKHGRGLRAGGQYVALSCHSDDCPWHADLVAGTNHYFPPRTQPMHTVRRGLLAALHDIACRNREIADPQRDRVAIVTYDNLASEGAWVEQTLTSDYTAVARKITRLQAVGRLGRLKTDTKALEVAESLLEQAAREMARGNSVSQQVVLVTAGPSPDDSALDDQITKMQRLGQIVHAIQVGYKEGGAGDPTPITSVGANGRGNREGPSRFEAESVFRATVVPVSIVLVE